MLLKSFFWKAYGILAKYRWLFPMLIAAVIISSCAGKRVTGNWKTGVVSEVTLGNTGEIVERKPFALEEQAEWLRKIGAPEDIIMKAQKGEELSPKDQFALENLMKKNSEEPREPIRSISMPGRPGMMIVPKPSVRPGGGR